MRNSIALRRTVRTYKWGPVGTWNHTAVSGCAQNLIDLFQCYLPRRSQIPFTTFWVVWFSERHTESEHRLLRCQVKKNGSGSGTIPYWSHFWTGLFNRNAAVPGTVRRPGAGVNPISLFRVWTDHDWFRQCNVIRFTGGHRTASQRSVGLPCLSAKWTRCSLAHRCSGAVVRRRPEVVRVLELALHLRQVVHTPA